MKARRTRRWVGGVPLAPVLAAAVLLAGCSSGTDDPPEGLTSASATPSDSVSDTPSETATATPSETVGTPSPTAASTSASPSPSGFTKYDDEPAVRGYFAWLAAYDKAAKAFDAADPDLVSLSSRTRAQFDAQSFAQHKKSGHRRGDASQTQVVGLTRLSSSSVRLNGCDSTTHGQWLTSAGKPVDRAKTAWEPVDIRMVKRDGTWKLDALYGGKFSCKAAR